MSIKPFLDRPRVDPGKSETVVSASGGIDTSLIDKYRSGHNIRSMSDFSKTLTPVITSRGIPKRQNQRFNPSLEVNTFGQSKLFEDPSPDGKPAPFDDIANLKNPIAFINAPDTTQYPVVLLSPNWLDPAQLDGVIEPLTIRSKINNTSNEGPFTAHDFRGSLMPNVGHEIESRSVFIESFIEYEPVSKIPPYFDSQDLAMGEGDFKIAIQGFSFPEEIKQKPFDDTANKGVHHYWASGTPGAIEIKYDQSFSGDFRVGVFGKSPTAGFTYRHGSYTIDDKVSTGENVTGFQKVTGVDSIAFGGLIK